VERWRVDQPAILPLTVQPAFELERRALADIALVDFAVVSDLLDRSVGPLSVEAEFFAEVARHAQKTRDLRIVFRLLLVDVLGRDAELLGSHQRVDRPGDDITPLGVALPDDRPHRILSVD